MTKLRRACENAELAALRELMKDFPEKMRGTLKVRPEKTYEIYS